MPVYDYHCEACQTQFQFRHAITSDPPPCPRCGSRVRQIFLSAPAVHGYMARGREQAAQTLETAQTGHGPGCHCCH